jgi:hypothetical protein
MGLGYRVISAMKYIVLLVGIWLVFTNINFDGYSSVDSSLDICDNWQQLGDAKQNLLCYGEVWGRHDDQILHSYLLLAGGVIMTLASGIMIVAELFEKGQKRDPTTSAKKQSPNDERETSSE